MNDYIELRADIKPSSETAADILAAFLADAGYESFVPDDNGLTAYIRKESFDPAALSSISATFPMECVITFSHDLVPGRDWNSEWEKHYFKPIVVGERCVIHSSFHTDIPKTEYDIVIDPKMAFGTGHHATTASVIEQLLTADLNGRCVIDMGTGTGILAILAAMRGATTITGIEIDPAAHANAIENVRLNGVDNRIDIVLGDASALQTAPEADIFIANINRNIITADLPRYVARLKPEGTMLLSGFYEEDVPVIMTTAAPLGLVETGRTVRDRWTCLKLQLKR
ncbi:MAG: 50S ribosomal protein L11 methyltransferase [Muribaculaceae bacterium]|nr:50S ribosomal protein L11 methyltransferase [Muribaculaceae bacterium]